MFFLLFWTCEYHETRFVIIKELRANRANFLREKLLFAKSPFGFFITHALLLFKSWMKSTDKNLLWTMTETQLIHRTTSLPVSLPCLAIDVKKLVLLRFWGVPVGEWLGLPKLKRREAGNAHEATWVSEDREWGEKAWVRSKRHWFRLDSWEAKECSEK